MIVKYTPTIHPGMFQSTPELRRLSNRLSLKYVREEQPDLQELKTIGTKLWEGLLQDRRFKNQIERTPTQPGHLVIRSDHPEIQSMPWECL